MKNNIGFKGFEADESIRKVIHRLISKLEMNANTFSPELAHLRLMVDRNSVRKLYTISVTLDLPGKTLPAREDQRDLQAGIRAAFAEIERQLKKYKASLRREHWMRL